MRPISSVRDTRRPQGWKTMNEIRGLVPRHDTSLQSSSKTCGSAGHCPFTCGTPNGRQGLCDLDGQWTRFERGAVIALQGDRQDGLLLVLQGMLKLSKSLEDGRTQIVALRFPGDIVSARPSAEAWQVTVEAAQPTTLCQVNRRSMNSLPKQSPIHAVANERAFAEVMQAQEHMVTLGRRAPMERLALFLLELDRRQQSAGRGVKDLYISLSRADIGDYLGLKGETISRLFTRLKDAGVITVHTPSRIGLDDRDTLEDLAEGRAVELLPAVRCKAPYFAERPSLAAAVP